METPSSMRRVTRSQTLAAVNNSATNSNSIPISRKIEDSEMSVSKSKTRNAKHQQDRSALIDISNDSPIVGLAMETPSSAITKQRSSIAKKTPGSGEALLRGQVKTLLQRVEEEAELSKLSMESRPCLHLKNLINSPMGLLAPTPANTPQINDLSGDDLAMGTASPVSEEQQMIISQAVSDIFEGKREGTLESQKSLITRSLLLDFSEKSDISDSLECSSVVTTGNSESKEKSTPEDDNSSVWSIQVNASTHDEDDEEIIEEEGEVQDDYYEEDAEEEDDGRWIDELCKGVSKISVKRKHTRFVYNSDDEIAGEEECEDLAGESPDILRLKGLPTPKGKHLRFPVEEEDS
ncbi:hypothetical protein SLE2022_010080 [Rubroshorea leprosula]